MAEALSVPPAHAFGLYVAVCLGFGQHRPDGLVSSVTDTTLEGWARWTGKPGRFAAAFRARCTSDGRGKDPEGVIRGWWRQRALLAKQSRDAAKPDGTKHRLAPPTIPRGISAGVSRETTTNTVTKTEQQVVGGDARAREPVGIDAVRDVTMALNRGMLTNPGIGQAMNPVIASSGTQQVADWLALGIPLDLICRVVEEVGRTYRPKGRNTQIHGLGYCDRAVKDAWERESQKPALPSTGKLFREVTA